MGPIGASVATSIIGIGETIRVGVRRSAYPHRVTPNALIGGTRRAVEQRTLPRTPSRLPCLKTATMSTWRRKSATRRTQPNLPPRLRSRTTWLARLTCSMTATDRPLLGVSRLSLVSAYSIFAKISNDAFGSRAAPKHVTSPTAASGGKAVVPQRLFRK